MNAARAVAPSRVPSRAPSRARAATTVNDAAEREAQQAGTAAARALLPTRWSFAAVPVSPPQETTDEPDGGVADAMAGPGRALDRPTRAAMEARFRVDLSTVRVHDDARTAAATRAVGARGLTVGDDVAFAEHLDTASPASRELLAHELAHVVQQRAAGARAVQRNGGTPGVPATTLAGLPDADRQRIQLVTTKVTIPDLAGKFATTGTKTTIPVPSSLTAAFDASVDPALQTGLSNVVGSLTTTIDLTEVVLVPNTTITLELDVGGTAGKGLYRFTHHAAAAAPGAKGPAKPQGRVLVEALGKATAPPGTKAPAAAKPGATPAPDPVADKIKSHSLSVPSAYKGAELDALRAALDQIPGAQLTLVDGLKFARDTASPDDPKANGDYDYKTHTVTMYDQAFTASQTRTKGPGTVASDSATRAIVHEIGHAVDLQAIRKARLEQKKADAAVDALYGKYANPKDPKNLQYPTGGAEEEEVKRVLKAQKDADAKVLSTKSLSGTKTVQKPGSADFDDVIGTDVKGNQFREAAAKDGGKAVTAYGSKDFQEAFAEAYSLYITAPDTLKTLRPNVYDYLDKNLPK